MVLFNGMPSHKWGLTVILLLFCSYTLAQENDIKGKVTDSLGMALDKATITFSPNDGGKTRRTITDNQGYFSIPKRGSQNFRVLFSMLGFATDTLSSGEIKNLDSISIVLHQTAFQLEEVMVISHPKQPILISKDTISYDLASFAGKNDRYLVETLSRIKGLRVNENGEVYALGEKVTKIMLNDEEIFNGDVGLLTRNLPLELLETAELINDYGKESAITGMKGTPTKTLNIHTKKPSVIGVFGELKAGAGNGETYLGNGTANYFDKQNQFSITAGTNNINKSNMLSSSIMDNSSTAQLSQEGLNRSTNFSVNGRTKFGKNSQLYLSADQNNGFNRTFGEGRTTTIQQQDNIDYDESFARTSKDRNRRFNLRYDLSSSRFSINVSPWIRSNKQNINEQRDALFFSSSDSARTYSLKQKNIQDALGLDGSVHYKFDKPKRTLAIKIKSEKEELYDDQNIFNDFNSAFDPLHLSVDDKRNRSIISPSIAYTEPIGKNGVFEIAYHRSDNRDNLDRSARNQIGGPIDSLSGKVESQIVKNHLDSRFQLQTKAWLYDVTLSYQNDYLQTNDYRSADEVTIEYKKLLPSFQVTYSLTDQKSITLMGKRYNTLPLAYQVVSIPTLTDPLFVYSGNTGLLTENSMQATLSFKSLNANKGSVFRANVDYITTENKIIANSAQIVEGSAQQFVSLSNADGYKRINGDYFFSRGLGNRKVIDVSGRVSYDNNPQYINNELNYGRNFNIHQTLKFLWPVTKSININPSVMYRLTDIDYGIQDADISPISTVNMLLDIAYKSGNFASRLGANKIINSGFSGNSYNNLIINSSISYKLLDGACLLNLEISDLLNNNTGIRRSINNNTISDLSINRLSRYFMFSVNYKIGNFK